MKFEPFDFLGPRILRFGNGLAGSCGAMAKKLGIRNALLVSDQSLSEICQPVTQSLSREGVRVCLFDQTGIEPSTLVARQAVEPLESFRVDGVIAVGGGSVMDLAKLCSATLGSGQQPTSFFGFDQVPGNLPLICLPTTAGTGSEVSHAAIIVDERDGTKKSILSQRLRPDAAIVDPELTFSCPARLTAESGIDALTHALEAFLVTDASRLEQSGSGLRPYCGKNSLSDLHAGRAIELIANHLEAAVNEPAAESRTAMALGATLAGLAFSNAGVTLVHALEYPIGCRYGCPHGAGNGILLPEFLRFLSEERKQEIRTIAGWMHLEQESVVERVMAIRRNIGLPESLTEVGAKQDDLPQLAETAGSITRLMELCPKKVDNQDLLCILRNSL
ncbi:MAG: iron-containing alcohol dehydrogenase [Planctomycetota bacterium]|nr:iron-containing alcohol dehydrogenase [Planctomycetota bacterium]